MGDGGEGAGGVMEEGRKRVRKERTEGGGRSKTIGRLLATHSAGGFWLSMGRY